MPYAVSYNSTEDIIVSSMTGRVGWIELTECVINMMQTAKQESCFCLLSDLRQAEINLSTADNYSFLRVIAELAAAYRLNPSDYKHAFVTPNNRVLHQLFEKVSVNRVQRTILFSDINNAKNWLQGK